MQWWPVVLVESVKSVAIQLEPRLRHFGVQDEILSEYADAISMLASVEDKLRHDKRAVVEPERDTVRFHD